MRNKLFTNKAIHSFQSIFERREDFQIIIDLVDQFPSLFPETRPAYTAQNYSAANTAEIYIESKNDFNYLKEEFFVGTYKQDEKDSNHWYQTKRAIFEKFYDNFLTLSNIIDHSKTRENINFGGYSILVHHAWINCSVRTYILIRSILNNDNLQKDDISIWKICGLDGKHTNDELLTKLRDSLDFVMNKFKFKTVLKPYINKTLVHLTNWKCDEKIEEIDKELITLKSIFNLFECLYVVLKILYWYTAGNEKIHDLMMDAENYNYDMLQQTLIAQASQSYYDEKLVESLIPIAGSFTRKFCRENGISEDFTKLADEERIKVKQYLANELVNLKDNFTKSDFRSYSDIIFNVTKKQN